MGTSESRLLDEPQVATTIETAIEAPPKMALIERFRTVGFLSPSGAPMPPPVMPVIDRVNEEIVQHHRWAYHMLRYGFHKVIWVLARLFIPFFLFNFFGWIAFVTPLQGRARDIWMFVYIGCQVAMLPVCCGMACAQHRCCATSYPIIRLLRERVQPLVDAANQTLIADGIRLQLDVVDKARDVSRPDSSGSHWVFEMESSLIVCAANATGAAGAGPAPSSRPSQPRKPHVSPAHREVPAPSRAHMVDGGAEGITEPVVMGLPVGTAVAEASAHGSLPHPPLSEMVETFRRELGAGGETFPEVVDSACEKLGLKPSGTLSENAKKAYDQIRG